ncbi:MAG: hypothetical protein ACKO0N_09465, partial [Planctomycetota bacterium]
RWYCPSDKHLVYEAEFELKHIDRDLHRVMNEFWNGPVERRTCSQCGVTIERAGEFSIGTATPQPTSVRPAASIGLEA